MFMKFKFCEKWRTTNKEPEKTRNNANFSQLIKIDLGFKFFDKTHVHSFDRLLAKRWKQMWLEILHLNDRVKRKQVPHQKINYFAWLHKINQTS